VSGGVLDALLGTPTPSCHVGEDFSSTGVKDLLLIDKILSI
jgi:hypothetical protein